MKEMWHLLCDGVYQYSVYCEEHQLNSMKNAFLLWYHPMNETITSQITFEKVDLDDYELQEEDSSRY